jgi:hypothetical protein
MTWAGIGWHRDRPVFSTSLISLGARAATCGSGSAPPTDSRARSLLAPRSIYHL